MSIERRTVLAGGVAAGSLVALTACSAEEQAPVSATTPPSATVDEAEVPKQSSGELFRENPQMHDLVSYAKVIETSWIYAV